MTARSARFRVSADSLGTFSELGSGGQGTVYKLFDKAPGLQTLPYPNLVYVYKEYNQLARAALDPDVLDEMARYAAELTSDSERLGDRLAWPLATVERDGAVSGFLMRRVSPKFEVQLQLPRGVKQTLAEAQFLLNDRQYLADRRLPVHDRWRLQFLRDTAATLARLHRIGVTVGDLSPKNLLASFTTEPCCFFLDCDAMRIAGRSVLGQVETTGWEIPNGEEKATIASDAYKLALLAIRLFAGDQDSKDATALSAVDLPLGQLACRGISTNPLIRPTPITWFLELNSAIPRATTALPWERISNNAGGPTVPRRPATLPAPKSAPATAPQPSRSRPAPPSSAPNYRGKIFGIALAIVSLLFVINVLRYTKSEPSGEGATRLSPMPSAAAYAELNRQVMTDSPDVNTLAERWVPQLASAREGLLVNGGSSDYTSILREYRALRQQYPQARLVRSDSWQAFDGPGFFVTVLAVPFPTADDANKWCDQHDIDPDDCFAKLLSRDRGPQGTTRHRMSRN